MFTEPASLGERVLQEWSPEFAYTPSTCLKADLAIVSMPIVLADDVILHCSGLVPWSACRTIIMMILHTSMRQVGPSRDII